MTDMYETPVAPVDDRTPPTEPVTVPEVPVDHVPETVPADEANGTVEGGVWRAEAGRKGAKRVHQLIEAGRRYEQEHGLKSGRQRLRQLIQLGKLYEAEHGERPAGKKRRGTRLSRQERDEVVATLLKCLVRIAKPSFRAELGKLAPRFLFLPISMNPSSFGFAVALFPAPSAQLVVGPLAPCEHHN